MSSKKGVVNQDPNYNCQKTRLLFISNNCFALDSDLFKTKQRNRRRIDVKKRIMRKN